MDLPEQKSGCLSFLMPLLKLFSKKEEEKEALPYTQRDDFLSPAELSFYKVLEQAVGIKMKIFPKVALQDIFFVKTRDKSAYTRYHNKIARKHVDFLLCDPNITGKVDNQVAKDIWLLI